MVGFQIRPKLKRIGRLMKYLHGRAAQDVSFRLVQSNVHCDERG
jgi:hypothetical protein